MHSRERADARDPAAGPHDDPAVDLLAEDGVRAAHVARALGRDRRRLDAEAELAEGRGGVQDTLVSGAAALLERQVEIAGLDLDAEHARVEQAQGLTKKLFARLVAVQDSNHVGRHRPNHMARYARHRAIWAGPARSSATIDSA